MMRKLSVIVFVLLLSGCGWLYQLGGVSSSSDYDISKANLKVPTFEYVNQYDEPFGTKQLQGKYWLADTIFTFCPSVCPIMTPNMQRLQQTMKDEGISMSFVSFTVDPKRDTPEQLLSYGKNVGADLDSWHFLTGYTLDEIADFSDEAF